MVLRYTSEQNSELIDGYELRKQILRALLYANRNRPEILSRVREISSGTGHADLIQDLQNCKAISEENLEELKAINFDLSLLEKAATTADTLA